MCIISNTGMCYKWPKGAMNISAGPPALDQAYMKSQCRKSGAWHRSAGKACVFFKKSSTSSSPGEEVTLNNLWEKNNSWSKLSFCRGRTLLDDARCISCHPFSVTSHSTPGCPLPKYIVHLQGLGVCVWGNLN